MQIKPINSNVSFGYSSIIKTLYKKGKLHLKYGFYGDELTIKNCTIEHLKCVKDGGDTTLDNVVLTSANKNQERGTRPLKDMLNWEYVGKYLEQFKDVTIDNFDGNEYIQLILTKIAELIN